MVSSEAPVMIQEGDDDTLDLWVETEEMDRNGWIPGMAGRLNRRVSDAFPGHGDGGRRALTCPAG